LVVSGATPRFLGVTPSPQIFAYTGLDAQIDGFFYISASHNPIGYNGFKMGLQTGGVLSAAIAGRVETRFRKAITDQHLVEQLGGKVAHLPRGNITPLLDEQPRWQQESRDAYSSFVFGIAAGGLPPDAFQHFLREGLTTRPLGIVGDLNGSARCLGPDRSLLPALGLRSVFIHDEPGNIAHQILPEGAGLEPVAAELQRWHQEDLAFSLGYTPDNDGDRGNIVLINPEGEPLILAAQDVFALIVQIELDWLHKNPPEDRKIAIVANGPTSLRVESLAARYGATVFRAEVGEANVVALGERLRHDGWCVPVVGEGSNGGVIMPPAAVRDPLNTIFSLVKHHCTGKTIVTSLRQLPQFITTGTDDPRAKLEVPAVSPAVLKERYETLLQERFIHLREELREHADIESYRVENHEGIETHTGPGNRSGDQSGGLRVVLLDNQQQAIGFLWMRGSRTEPIFRVIVDIAGDQLELHDRLIQWHRQLLTESC
jgi:phosphomannomutase